MSALSRAPRRHARTRCRWTRARAAAEGLKSEACMYLVGAAPYDSADRVARLSARLAELRALTKDTQPDDITADRAIKDMPAAAWTLDDYLRTRLDDQVDWYRKRAGEFTGL